MFGSRENERKKREKRANWNKTMKSCDYSAKMKVRVTKSYKIPKIYDYNGDKMGITQNEVVWIKNRGGQISLCIVNFAIIEKM